MSSPVITPPETHPVTAAVRLTSAELDALKNAAAVHGVSVSRYLRLVIIHHLDQARASAMANA